MKAEVVQSFVAAASDVLSQEMGGPVDPQRVRLQGGPYKTQAITVLIGLTQQLEGAVILGMSNETARAYCSHIMGEIVSELDELAQSGIAELANVIAGRAGALLDAKGFVTSISPPTVLLGEDGVLSTLSVPRLMVAVRTQYGVIDLQLAAREKRSVPGRRSAARRMAIRA
ncbi:MAG: chemotaxis protein CheX [Chloroflexota bacterium]